MTNKVVFNGLCRFRCVLAQFGHRTLFAYVSSPTSHVIIFQYGVINPSEMNVAQFILGNDAFQFILCIKGLIQCLLKLKKYVMLN